MQIISHLSKSETRVHLLYPNIIITVEIYLVNSNTRFKKFRGVKIYILVNTKLVKMNIPLNIDFILLINKH